MATILHEKKIAPDETRPVEVRKLSEHPDTKYHRVYLRDTERKELWSQLACLRVYPVENKLGEETWLIIRRDEGENETKYQFSSAPEGTSIERLCRISCSRYWIERALQDGKCTSKMADYQVRGWTGWHQHMVMTLLAMLFILELQVEFSKKAPMLSVQDLRRFLRLYCQEKKLLRRKSWRLSCRNIMHVYQQENLITVEINFENNKHDSISR